MRWPCSFCAWPALAETTCLVALFKFSRLIVRTASFRFGQIASRGRGEFVRVPTALMPKRPEYRAIGPGIDAVHNPFFRALPGKVANFGRRPATSPAPREWAHRMAQFGDVPTEMQDDGSGWGLLDDLARRVCSVPPAARRAAVASPGPGVGFTDLPTVSSSFTSPTTDEDVVGNVFSR